MLTLPRLTILATFLMLAVVAATVIASAHEFKQGDIMIGHPWARATPGPTKNGAAFLVLMNQGAAGDSLVAASTPVAERAELHTHEITDGVMKMRPVDLIEVAPGATTELKPSGLHIMMMGLKQLLKEGERFPLTLSFENAGTVEVEVTVEAIGAMKPMGEMDHGEMDHGEGEMQHQTTE